MKQVMVQKKKKKKKSRAEKKFDGQKKKKKVFWAGNCLKQIMGQKSEVFNFFSKMAAAKWPPAAILDIGMRPKSNWAKILP